MAGRGVRDVASIDPDAPRARPEPGDHLGELALPVAGDRRDPDDLAAADREGRATQRGQLPVVDGLDVADLEDGVAEPGRGSLHGLNDFAPDHLPGQPGAGRPGGRNPGGRDLAPAHDRDPVGDREHLAELVADEHDAPSAGGHRSERPEQLVDLLRGEYGRRFVHDENPRTAVEQLQDLDALLLTDRQLPDLGARIDPQAELFGELAHLGLGPAGPQQEARRVQPEDHVLGDRLGRDQGEMLVDHADAGGDRIAWGVEQDRLTVEQDLAAVRTVQAGQDVHERALAGAVLAQHGMDLADAQVEGNPVVGEDTWERLDDPASLQGVRRASARRDLRAGIGHGHGRVVTGPPVVRRRTRISVTRAPAARR